MNCTYKESTAYRFADRSLEADRHAEFATHLVDCAECRARVAEAERLEETLKASIVAVPAPASMAGRVAQAVAAEREAQRPRFALPFLGRRFATALGALALALALVVVVAGPESVMAVVQRALFFVPGIGISNVEADTLVATGPVSARDGNLTFTVEALLSDRESTRIQFSLSGLPGGKPDKEKPVRVGEEPPATTPAKAARPPALRDDSGREYPLQSGWHGTGGSQDENHVTGTLLFAPLPATMRAVELTVPAEFVVPVGLLPDAETKAWTVRVPLAPAAQSSAPLVRPQSSAATVEDVTLRVAASAVEDGKTVLLVEGEAPGTTRVISLVGNGQNPDEAVSLRDNLGRTYGRLEPTGTMAMGENELRQTLYYSSPAPLAGDFTLTVQTAMVAEKAEAEVVIPLAGRAPGETFTLDRTIDLGGHPVRLLSGRVVQEQGAPWLYVDVDLGPSANGRTLSTFSVDGDGSWMSSNGAKEGTQMSHFGVELRPGQTEARLRLTTPLISVDGPWILTFPVDGK